MAKGGNGKAQAKGHENANENFANGYCENGAPNENAAKGLANALEHNPFECASSGTTIDFDSGVVSNTFDNGWKVGGTYTQGDYEVDYFSADYFFYTNIGDPIFDADGDGDAELGVDVSGFSVFEGTFASIENTEGNNFALESFDLEFVDDGILSYNYFGFYHYEDNGDYIWHEYAYTNDGVNWTYQDAEYDYSTGTSLLETGNTTDEAEIAAIFDNVEDNLEVHVYGDFTIDDIVLSDVAMA